MKLSYHSIMAGSMLLGVFNGFAQTGIKKYDTLPEWGEAMEHYFSLLDMDEISSGFLKDRGFFWINPFGFSGSGSIDTLKHFGEWKSLYGGISTSAIDSSYIPAHWDAWEGGIAAHINQNVTPIVVMHYQYHYLIEDREQLFQRIYVDENNRLHDVAGRSQSPYLQRELFAAAPYVSELYNTLQLAFRIDRAFIFDNQSKTLQSVHLDFGNGYQNVALDENISVSWSDYGTKYLKLKFTYTDGSAYESISILKLINTNSQSQSPGSFNARMGYDKYPDDSHYLTSGVSQNLGALLQIEYGCGNHKLLKPFIVVEGFNAIEFDGSPRGLQYGDFLDKLNHGALSLSDHLEQSGYDIVYVDFDQGDGDMRENAYVLMKAIQWINRQKEQNGSTDPNVITGLSMGGVIARYALLKLENQAPGTHDVRYYISFDSPHLGANIPIGYQWMIEHLKCSCIKVFGKTYCVTDYVPEINDVYNVLHRKGTSQLLRYYIGDNPCYNLSGLIGRNHLNFYTELRNMGMPLETEHNIGIANGNGQGNNQGFSSLQKLFDADCQSSYSSCLFDANSIHLKYFFNVHATPGYTSKSFRVYKGKMYYNPLGFLPPVYIVKPLEYKMAECYPFDNSPGGEYHINDFGFDRNAIPFSELDLIENFSFVPSISALNIESELRNPHYAANEDSLVAQNKTNFDEVHLLNPSSYPSSTHAIPANEKHLQFTPSNVDAFENWLFNDFDQLTATGIIDGKTYNYSSNDTGATIVKTTSRITKTINITGTSAHSGRLCVNCTGRIGFDDVGSNPSSTASHFVANITSGCTVGGVTIEDNGIIEIGTNGSKRGELWIRKGAFVRMKAGSKLIVRDGSKLVVDDGAKLIFEKGARIELPEYGSILRIQGKLTIGDSTDFTIRGNGRLVFDQNVKWARARGRYYLKLDEYWDIGQNATFTLRGPSNPVNYDHILIEAYKPVYLKMESGHTFDWLRIENGRIALHDGTLFFSFSPTTMLSVKVESAYSWHVHGGFRLWNNAGLNNIISCRFKRGNPATLFHWVGATAPIQLIACTFEDNQVGFQVDGGSFGLGSCTFNNNDRAIKAERLTGSSSIHHCKIIGRNNQSDMGLYAHGQEGSALDIAHSKISNNVRGVELDGVNTRVSCTEFSRNDQVSIMASECLLDISEGAGNVFLGNNAKDIYITGDHQKAEILMEEGQNDFAARGLGQGLYLLGYIFNGYPTFLNGQPLPANNNKMPVYTQAQYIYMPVSFAYGDSVGNIREIPLNIPNNLSSVEPDCDNDAIDSYFTSAYYFIERLVDGGGRVWLPESAEISLKEATLEALSQLSFAREIRDDTLALRKIIDILKADIRERDPSTGPIIKAIYREMFTALNNSYQCGSMEHAGREESAEVNEVVGDVIEIINTISTRLAELNASSTWQRETELFNRNLEKAHVYRVSGYYNRALEVLNNSGDWVFDFTQEQRAAYWTCVCEVEQAFFREELPHEEYAHRIGNCQNQYAGYSYKNGGLAEYTPEGLEGYVIGKEPDGNTTLSIYPQPVGRHLYVTSNEPLAGVLDYRIANATGQVVCKSSLLWQGDYIELEVSDLNPGLYLIHFSIGDQTTALKFVKQ